MPKYDLAICVMSNQPATFERDWLNVYSRNALWHLVHDKGLRVLFKINMQKPYTDDDAKRIFVILEETGVDVSLVYHTYTKNEEGQYPIMRIRQDSLVEAGVSKYTLMCDDDMSLTREFVEGYDCLVEYINEHPRVGVVVLQGPLDLSYYDYRKAKVPRTCTFEVRNHVRWYYPPDGSPRRRERCHARISLGGGFFFETDKVMAVWNHYDWSDVYGGWDDNLRTSMLLLAGYINVRCSIKNIHNNQWNKMCWNAFRSDDIKFKEMPASFNTMDRDPYRIKFEKANGIPDDTLDGNYQIRSMIFHPVPQELFDEFSAKKWKGTHDIVYNDPYEGSLPSIEERYGDELVKE